MIRTYILSDDQQQTLLLDDLKSILMETDFRGMYLNEPATVACTYKGHTRAQAKVYSLFNDVRTFFMFLTQEANSQLTNHFVENQEMAFDDEDDDQADEDERYEGDEDDYEGDEDEDEDEAHHTDDGERRSAILGWSRDLPEDDPNIEVIE